MVHAASLIPGLPAGTPVDDRVAHGKDARKTRPRSELGAWQPDPKRPRAVDLLTGQETTRIPGLVPIRHSRMAVSPFTFYRGAAIVMAADLGLAPNSGLYSQLCGDAHLANLGVFGSAEHNLVFDVNDFDETAPGPFEWDLLRLSTSFVLAARDNGLGDEEAVAAATKVAESYQQIIALAAQRPILENFYTAFTPEDILGWVQQAEKSKNAAKAEKRVTKAVGKIKSRDSWSAVLKLTEVGPDGRRRFLDQPPLLTRIDGEIHGIDFGSVFDQYVDTMEWDRRALIGRYEVVDVAHKVVGVGSVGLPALVGLLQGRDAHDVLVLQFKAAEASVLEKWTKPSPFAEHGQRVVVGQRIMQASGDPFLGWVTGPRGVAFYGRQLRDFKWSVDLAGLKDRQLLGYASLCGSALAMAHARAGDPVAISSYIGTGPVFPTAVKDFSMTYADLVKQDYAEFTAAIADGEIEAAPESG